MVESIDREILLEAGFGWPNQFGELLSEEEVSNIETALVGEAGTSTPNLRGKIERAFHSLCVDVLRERFRKRNGAWQNAPKPSTIVSRDLKKLQKSLEKFDSTLANLDPVTRDFLDMSLEKSSAQTEKGNLANLSYLKRQLRWPLDQLLYGTMLAESITSPGPANVSLHNMVNRMAILWKECRGSLPISDRGRGRMQYDDFLELCQNVAGLARQKIARLTDLKKGELANIGSTTLVDIVSTVLKELKTSEADREKSLPETE